MMLAPQNFIPPKSTRRVVAKSVISNPLMEKTAPESLRPKTTRYRLVKSKIHPDYPHYDGDVEGPYKAEFIAELDAQLAQSRADKANGIESGLSLEQVMRNLGIDHNN